MKTDSTKPRDQPGTDGVQTLYRISSAMAQLQVSRTSIYRLVARGDLEMVRIGARISRITSESLSRLIAGKSKKRD